MNELRKNFLQLLEDLKHDMLVPSEVVAKIKLPSNAVEIIINNDNIMDKLEYYKTAYNDDFKLINNNEVELIDIQVTMKSFEVPCSTIDKVIRDINYYVVGKKTTICCITLKNNFEVIGYSSCVDINNFDKNIGEKISFEKAKEKIWELEGYLLQENICQILD